MYTFEFELDMEPDTGWTLRITGSEKGDSLYDAECNIGLSLGGTFMNAIEFHQDEWRIFLVHPDQPRERVYRCDQCYSDPGCERCGGKGFLTASEIARKK